MVFFTGGIFGTILPAMLMLLALSVFGFSSSQVYLYTVEQYHTQCLNRFYRRLNTDDQLVLNPNLLSDEIVLVDLPYGSEDSPSLFCRAPLTLSCVPPPLIHQLWVFK